MNVVITAFKENLITKCENLRSISSHPRLFVSEHFFSIRIQVDCAAERLLEAIANSGYQVEERCSSINSSRSEMIQELEKAEKLLLDILARPANKDKRDSFGERFQLIHDTINDSFPGNGNARLDLNDYEDIYEQLANELTKEAYNLDKLIFSNQTWFFLKTTSDEKTETFGHLIQMADEYLDSIETSCFRSSCIFIRKPVVLNRRIMLMISLARPIGKYLKKNECNILKIDMDQLKDQDHELISFLVQELRAIPDALQLTSVEVIEETTDSFQSFSFEFDSCYMSGSQIKTLNSLPPYLTSNLVWLNMMSNNFSHFDEHLFSPLKQLLQVEIQETFDLDVSFNLDFVFSMPDLIMLSTTLPDNPASHEMFLNNIRSIRKLNTLNLRSPATRDANRPRIKLTREIIDNLASLSQLKLLELHGFQEIVSRDIDTFTKLSDLSDLRLNNDNIEEISVPTRFPLNLKKLDLSRNLIRRVSFESFEKLSVLFYLSLSHNLIESLAETSNQLEHLTVLYLNDNSIAELPSGIFDCFPSLEMLHLGKNKLKRICKDTFTTLKNLRFLYLQNNPIESIEANAFLQLSNLGQLSLNNCQLKSIDNQMFNGLVSLYDLSLYRNQIDSIVLNISSLPSPIKLVLANLENEYVRSLVREHMFSGLKNLLYLDLLGNQLTELDLYCFWNMKLLKRLTLSDNKLTKMTNQFPREEPLDIQDLHLENNRLQTFDASFFRSFRNLDHLYLQNNMLDMTIDGGTFPPECRLKEFNLYGNVSITIHQDAFYSLPNLQMVFVDNLTSDCSFNVIKLNTLCVRRSNLKNFERLFKNIDTLLLKGLARLDLSNNGLSSLDDVNLSQSCPHLSELVLAENQFKHINPDWFAQLANLRNLDMSGNQIQTLNDPDVFIHRKSISFLNLSKNGLEGTHPRIFRCLIGLVSLDLSDNNLKTIDNGQFRDLISLEKIFLRGNSLKNLNLRKLFGKTRRLNEIDLSNNQLKNDSINEMAFETEFKNQLTFLNLSGNRLSNLGFIRNLRNLKDLDLSTNQIESVFGEKNVNLFGRLMILTNLDLSNNKIKSVDRNVFDHLANILSKIDLSGNPLESNLELVHLQEKHNIFIVN